MPSKIHECAAQWLYEMISRGLATGIIPIEWVETMAISPSPSLSPIIVYCNGEI